MKRRAKKNIMPAICLIFVMSIVGCGCTGKEVTIRYDGFFQYIIVGENSRFQDKNNKAVAIVGFTASGMEQEALDIPREIDGKIVQHIGLRDEGFLRQSNSHHVVCSENLKKIYVHDNIKNIVYFEGLEVDMMVCSTGFNIIFEGNVFLKRIYIYKSLFDGIYYPSDVFPANIAFLHNFSILDSNNYFRLDNIESGEKIPVPPNPVRSGHEFIGWYTEPDCINAWDFDMSPTIHDDIEFRLYAGWQTK